MSITNVTDKQGSVGQGTDIQARIDAEARTWNRSKLRLATYERLTRLHSQIMQQIQSLEALKSSQEHTYERFEAARDAYNQMEGLEGSWLQLRDQQALRLNRLISDLAARRECTVSELEKYREILNVLAELKTEANLATF